MERSPRNRRGYFSSYHISAIGLISVIGGIAGLGTHSLFTEAAINNYAWRLPFAFGLLIVPVTIFFRRRIPEVQQERRERTPLRHLLRQHKFLSIILIGAFTPITITNYALAFYLPTFAVKFLHLSPVDAFLATAVYGLLQCILSPVFGRLSDALNRRQMMAIAALSIVVLTIPSFLPLVASPSLSTLVIAEVVLGLATTAYQAPMPALLSDLFPNTVRTTGIAVAHDLTATIFGGFTPFIITLLVSETGNNIVPAIYITLFAIIAFLCMLTLMRFRLVFD